MSGHRDWAPSSEEHRPITYWGGYPIYATHFIVIVYCVLMVITAIGGRSFGPVLDWTAFYSQEVLTGQVWRIVTYGLFNQPGLDFAFSMLMLFWFGRELERFFGRRVFGILYGGVYLIPTVLLTLIGLITPTSRLGQPGALAVFIAFATQFPGMPVFFTLIAKWAAFILVGIYSMVHLASRDWISLAILGATCAYAHFFIRYQQGSFELPRFRAFRRKPKLRVLPDLKPGKPARAEKTVSNPPTPPESMAEVDALLDKIATSGISSLTPKERAKLEAAREDLLKRSASRE
jgi:membrane associated rhomboid family serine protease